MRTSLTTGARRPLRTALAAVLSGLVWVSMAVVPAAAAGENTLATLSITGLSLDPAFSSATTSYLADDVAATASNGKYPITISATATDPTTGTNQAKVQYSLDGGSTWLPSSSPSRVLSASASLDLGSQEIKIRVDPSSGSDEIYSVGVDVFDGRNKLTALSFSGSGCSTFTTAFNSSTLDYEVAAVCSPSQFNDDVSVAFTAQSTNADVYWELNDSDSDQWLDDTDAALASSPIDVDLLASPGAIQGFYPNEIKLSVIPESWTAADLVEPADYTITFYWKGTDTYANLNDLDLSVGSHVPLSPAFDPAEVNYTAGPVSATSVVVIPDRGDVGQGVEVRSNGGTWTTIENEESASVSLTSGTNTINVRVTATDRATTKTYTITLTTSGTGTAVLSGLLISAGTLSPAFASGTLNYTASVPSATSSIDVTATGAGTLTRTVNGGTESSVTSGVSFNVTLTDNAVTTIRVKVTNGAANATYAIVVTRGTANPTLATLSLGTACTLAPAFTPNTPAPTTPYACTVLATTTSVSVSATPTTVGDTVQWRIGTGDFGTAASLTLAAGVNNVEVKVTRSGGGGGGGSSSSTYKINVTKPGAPGFSALSLTANGKAVALTPAFAATTYAYEAKVLGTSVLVSFTKSDTNATVKAIFDSSQVAVTGSSLTVPLDAGKNVITLEITPAGGGTPTNYVLEIRAPRCKVVNVVGLTLKEARAKLKQNNCLVRVQRENSSTVARNTVIRQDPVVSLNPKQNKRAPGFRVTLYVSKGP